MKFEDALKEAREKGTALRLKGEEVYQNSHLIYKENDSIFYANGRPLYDNAECALYKIMAGEWEVLTVPEYLDELAKKVREIEYNFSKFRHISGERKKEENKKYKRHLTIINLSTSILAAAFILHIFSHRTKIRAHKFNGKETS